MLDTRDMKIFIVVDDKFYSSIVRDGLKKSNFENVIVFDNEQSFLDNLFRMPDVVILDDMLDNANGKDILRKIKSVNPDIQVIFLSAREEMNIVINSLKYGAFDYLKKGTESLSRLIFILNRIVQHNMLAKESKKFKILKKALCFSVAFFVGAVFYLSKHLEWQY